MASTGSELVRVRADDALRGLVAGYSGYRDAGVAPARHHGLPSPYLTLILTLDDPLHVVEHPDPHAPPDRYDGLAGGLHTRPALIVHDGWQSGVQVALSPLASRAVFGLPAGELSGLDLHADQVLGRFADDLRERLLAAGTWAQRFAVLDGVLRDRVAGAQSGRPAPEVVRAWRLLQASGGRLPVARLAAEVGWSTRYLDRRFRTEIGLGPKAAARVIRFDRTRRELERRVAAGTAPVLAEVAADFGYCDQAHLAGEFNRLAGSPPSRWLADEVRFGQAGVAADGPGSSS